MSAILTSAYFWSFLGLVITGLIGFFAGKGRSKAEVKGIEVTNDKEILSTYKTELEYFSEQLKLTRKEISELRIEVGKLIESSCGKIECKNRVR